MHVISHRGCLILAPKNTLATFDTVAARLNWVELDIRCCSPGELVVVHDEALNHVTDAPGRVAKATLTELQALTIGDSDKSVPTFATVFGALPNRVSVNAKLKERSLIDDLATVIGGAEHGILVSSFDAEALREVYEATAPPVALLFVADWAEPLSVTANLDCAAVHPHYDLLSSVRIEEARNYSFEVNAWTVPDREIVQWLRECSVDGVVVDDPALAE